MTVLSIFQTKITYSVLTYFSSKDITVTIDGWILIYNLFGDASSWNELNIINSPTSFFHNIVKTISLNIDPTNQAQDIIPQEQHCPLQFCQVDLPKTQTYYFQESQQSWQVLKWE